MEKLNAIKKIFIKRLRVSSLVIVQKRNGALRILLDPRDLNKAGKREHFKLPMCKEIMSNFADPSALVNSMHPLGFGR